MQNDLAHIAARTLAIDTDATAVIVAENAGAETLTVAPIHDLETFPVADVIGQMVRDAGCRLTFAVAHR